MEEPSVAFILIFGFGTSLLVSIATLYFLRDKLQFGLLFWMIRAKVVAQADAAPMAPFAFTLRHLGQDAKVHRVSLKLRLRSQTGFSGRANVGLKCTYQVTIGGTVVAKEVVGYGSCPPEPYDRHITRTFFTGDSHWGAGYTKNGTIILGKLEQCPRGQEMVVEGSCEVEPGTKVEAMVVQFRA